MKSHLPQELLEVADYLCGRIEPCTLHEDGRRNSQEDEDNTIPLLIEKYGEENVEVPPARHWWDVRLFGKYCINIKSSDFSNSAADNFSSKAAILYAFTDIPEAEIRKAVGWSSFQSALLGNRSDTNNRDYYLLVIDKKTKDVRLQSLKSLNKLTSNGSNLPFQVNWSEKLQPVKRTGPDAWSFVIGAYKDSVRKKVTVHSGFENL